MLTSLTFSCGPVTMCSLRVLWTMSYSRPDVPGWASGHILILFTGMEGPKSVPWREWGHRVNHQKHVSDQSKQETHSLPLEFNVTIRLVVSWFYLKLKPGQLYIMFISIYWITVASCKRQWLLKRRNVFLATCSLCLHTLKWEWAIYLECYSVSWTTSL